MSEAIQKVGEDTEALKSLEKDMSAVAEQTADIKTMDQRMANIEEAMPTLVEVQQHLARVPDTLENLNAEHGAADRAARPADAEPRRTERRASTRCSRR